LGGCNWDLGPARQLFERQPPHRGRGVELLGHRDERDTVSIEQLDQFGKVRQRPRQAVDLVDDDDVNLPGADIVQTLFGCDFWGPVSASKSSVPSG
jgi:hypothetical protein